MKFIDEIYIKICSGSGGDGCISFRRERFIAKGGPDGGDGGKGGSVIFRASSKKYTLHHLKINNFLKASDGRNGKSKNMTGKSGEDLVIDIPVGTVLFDADENHVLFEMVNLENSFTILKGGKGGKGNSRFVSSTNRAPKICQSGELGCKMSVRLELKLMVDVGIFGLPNAGKSTLLSVISSAKPKVGEYPFTTIIPNLGFVDKLGVEPFVVVDIPGLIKGAHNGVGLGLQFLKHIERASVLVHLVDVSQVNFVLENIKSIETELRIYSENLQKKKCILVLNKIDLCSDFNKIDSLKKDLKIKKYDFLFISAITLDGVDRLIYKLSDILFSSKKFI